MNTLKEYRCECIMALMMIAQLVAILRPSLFPSGFSELLLLILLISFIISKINTIDLAIRRKYN